MSKFNIKENAPIIIAFVVVLLVIAALIGYFMQSRDTETTDTDYTITIPAPLEVPDETSLDRVEPEAEPEPEPPAPEPVKPTEEAAAFVLPLLDDSDSLVRDGVLGLTRHEDINAWLGPDNLIRKYAAFVDNLARGQVARELVQVLRPTGKFLVTSVDEDTWELDTESYARYNLFVDIVESVNARRAAELYVLIHSLLQDAYADLGYAEDKSFDDTLFQAIDRLLKTPTVKGPIRLVRPVVLYEFEDARLESLSPAQKQMVRMGSDNTRRLQAKLGEVALELRALLNTM